ncbi:MAG: hypothetical protein ACYSUI_17840 [Planctomycetota bacterium]
MATSTQPAGAADPAAKREEPGDVVWRSTLQSWGQAAHSPWAALAGDSAADELPVLAAPIDSRYVVLSMEIQPVSPSTTVLHVVDGQDSRATIRLLIDDQPLMPLGQLTNPSRDRDPFDVQPVQCAPQSSPVRLALAFLVSGEALSAQVELDGAIIKTLALQAESIPPHRIAGTWRKVPPRRVPMRFPDPVLDAVCSSDHQVLAVRRAGENGWLFEFPFTDLTPGPATVVPSSGIVECTLSCGGDQRQARARLVDGGQAMILYLGEDPLERLVYRRQ